MEAEGRRKQILQFVLHIELKSWTREVDGATESRQKQPVKFPL